MRIAIATDGGTVSQHFGRCRHYTVIDVEEGDVTKRENLENPGHRPDFLPQYLNERGVDCIVSGGMGRKAQALFSQFDIDAVIGVEGDIEAVIDAILNDELEDGNNLCSPKHERAGHSHGQCH